MALRSRAQPGLSTMLLPGFFADLPVSGRRPENTCCIIFPRLPWNCHSRNDIRGRSASLLPYSQRARPREERDCLSLERVFRCFVFFFLLIFFFSFIVRHCTSATYYRELSFLRATRFSHPGCRRILSRNVIRNSCRPCWNKRTARVFRRVLFLSRS